MELLDTILFGNSLWQWLLAATVTAGTLIVLRLVQRQIGRRLAALAASTPAHWDDIAAALIARTRLPFLIILSLFAGALFVELGARATTLILKLTLITLIVQAGIWGNAILTHLLEHHRQRIVEKNQAAASSLNIIGFLGRVVLWTVVLLIALDNLGIDITALVTGLGIGGIAVALAVQNILGDLFASLSIVFDKPFAVGDFIIVNEYLGSVEYIGLKTTRLRSLSGEQLVFSNSDLLGSRIRNYGRMFERRVVFSIGVTYDTPREKLQRIPAIIREAVMAQDKTRFDRSHFQKYGDYALLFETVYYVLSPDYAVYMDTQQAINFMIHEAFEREGIEFAYPTQKLFVAAVPETSPR